MIMIIVVIFKPSMCLSCISYSTKFWQGKILVNLAKWISFANILPSQNARFAKLVKYSIVNLPKFSSPKP